MSYTHRLTNMYPPSISSTSHTHTSGGASHTSSTLRQASHSQSLLQSRIAAKRAEFENLRALRDLSANLATQLSTLEEKLGTLKDGAQSVALVLANWENVLRAINMAASTCTTITHPIQKHVVCSHASLHSLLGRIGGCITESASCLRILSIQTSLGCLCSGKLTTNLQ